MGNDAGQVLDGGRNVILVTVAEGPAIQAEAAFMAGALRRLDFLPSELATDFCTEEEAFQTEIAERRSAAILFAYQPEFREILQHLSGVARAAVDVPVAVVGDALLRDEPHPVFESGILALPGEPGLGIGDLLRGETPREADHAHTAPDLHFFGGHGPTAEPSHGSLFCELGTVPLWAARCARDRLPPTALLARLEAPAGDDAVPLEPEIAIAPLKTLGDGVRRVEWWDRHADGDVLACAAQARDRGIRQSARFMVSAGSTGDLAALADSGIDRVVFEVDRICGLDPVPGSAAAAEDLAPYAEACRSLGLQVGVLLVVGLPGEDRRSGDARLDVLRDLRPDYMRCVAFEPTGGHPVVRHVRAAGLDGSTERRWNRELHRALAEEGDDHESFIHNWAAGHMLLAEVETRGGARS